MFLVEYFHEADVFDVMISCCHVLQNVHFVPGGIEHVVDFVLVKLSNAEVNIARITQNCAISGFDSKNVKR